MLQNLRNVCVVFDVLGVSVAVFPVGRTRPCLILSSSQVSIDIFSWWQVFDYRILGDLLAVMNIFGDLKKNQGVATCIQEFCYATHDLKRN